MNYPISETIFFLITGPVFLVFLPLSFVGPFVLSRKLDGRWYEVIRAKSCGVLSDLTKWGYLGRPFAYAEAATSDRAAKRLFETSRAEFRAQLKDWEVVYCCLLTWSSRIFLASLLIYCLLQHIYQWPD